MNELKVYTYDDMLDGIADVDVEYCLKSEADKVIAELKDKLRHYPIMAALLESDKREIAELKKEKEYTLEHTTEVFNAQEKELRHQKYRRCLAMAKLCNEKWLVHNFAEIPTKLGFYDKWEKRFIELAEKFKEAK